MTNAAPTQDQIQCAAKRHQPWVRAYRRVVVGMNQTARVPYCSGCGMEFGRHAGRQS